MCRREDRIIVPRGVTCSAIKALDDVKRSLDVLYVTNGAAIIYDCPHSQAGPSPLSQFEVDGCEHQGWDKGQGNPLFRARCIPDAVSRSEHPP